MKRYAPLFEWPDRQQAQLGVAEEMVAALEQRGERRFHDLAAFKPDPPDCICLNEQGGRVALEVTEVVCANAARLNARGHEVYRDWKPGEVRDRIVAQLGEKDNKAFHGGPYAEIVVCLFTDEPMLTFDHITNELDGSAFGPYRQITAAYFVVSYDPATKSYPVYTLSIQNAA